jgi:hypothetical protein
MLVASCRSLLRTVGVDRAIGFTVIGRAWLSVAGIVSLVFVGRCLSPGEQGYYYTFGSLLALQVFVELGLTNVIMQFASHERAHLELTSRGTLEGSPKAKSRLASLLRLALKWYGVAALLFGAGMMYAGFAFFTRCAENQTEVVWQFPWVWTVLATAGILLVLPMLALLEGCGLVAEVAQFRVFQAVAANVALWAALLGGAGLAAAGVFATTNLAVAILWLLTSRRAILADLLLAAGREEIDWRGEVWPYQWRIAVSWLCGYLIFQLFTPMLFAYHGPVEAGRMGMALALAGAVTSLGTSWLTTKAPQFGVLIAHRRFDDLDRIFFRSLKQAVGVAALAAGFVMALVAALHAAGHPLAGRVLGLAPLSLLVLSTLVNVFVTAEAVYLRAFKREPFLPISVLNALFVGCSTYFLARFYGVTEMMLGYLAVNLAVGLGLGTWIFCRNRRSWRREAAPCV